MIVYTIEENLYGELIIDKHNVESVEGEKGERKFKCSGCSLFIGLYTVNENKQRVFETRIAAERELEKRKAEQKEFLRSIS